MKTFFLGCFIYITSLLPVLAQENVILDKELKAIELYDNKEMEASKKLFHEVLAEDPDNERVQEYLGSIAFEMMEYQKAAAYIKPLMEKHPKIARFHFKYAGAIGLYAKNNRMKAMFLLDDIKEHFHIAADLDKTFVDVRMALVQMYLELPGMFGGSKDKALTYAKEVQALDVEAGVIAMELISAAN